MRDRWKKKAYYTVVMILTALCLISGCGQESGEELKEISLEETQKEKEESSASALLYSGTCRFLPDRQ